MPVSSVSLEIQSIVNSVYSFSIFIYVYTINVKINTETIMSRKTKVIPGHQLILTSVKAHPKVLEDFQDASYKLITLQSLVNRSMHLFAHDKEFQKIILSYNKLLPSGSL